MRLIVVSFIMLSLVGCGFKVKQRQPGGETQAGEAERGAENVCGIVTSFADEKTPQRERHVATDGSDTTGDGSEANPYATIAKATQSISAGTAIRIHAGTYPGGIALSNINGTESAPIWIGGVEGEERPIIEGGTVGLGISRSQYVILSDLEVRDSTDHGIHFDDGGDFANESAARHIVFSRLYVHDISAGVGAQSCLKLSGVNDFLVVETELADCGGPGGGAGIDIIGGHRGIIVGNYLHSIAYSGIQARGGSLDIEIRANFFDDAGLRGVNMGGATSLALFRPPLSSVNPNYEARYLRVLSNVFKGGETAASFTGCADCTFANNTVHDPSEWVLRILQETSDQSGFTFLRASKGKILNNIFYFSRADLSSTEDIDVGTGTWPSTFTIGNNLWYAHDDNTLSPPRLPNLGVTETDSITGADPSFINLPQGDYRVTSTSPAVAKGRGGDHLVADFSDLCYGDPPTIGANETK